ncbi:2EXR domain-containing protein [Madurella fahalii]|uniref:2EXR domain-containing protein n=1 Tax=Madurella fahalii TaxID=1157608 RepID=A0ABQ0GKM3_9PEZI
MSDISGESDHMGYLFEESGHDESSETNQDNAYNGSRVLDLEAADSGDESSSADGNGPNDDASFSWPKSRELHFFPQFKRFPIEIRQRIWEFFCPDLVATSRVLWLHCMPKGSSRVKHKAQVSEGPVLEQQTRPVRTILAVHGESRRLALKVFPDVLSIRNGVLRFNASRDVIFLDPIDTIFREFQVMPEIPGFTELIHHLAVNPAVFWVLDARESQAPPAFASFKSLKNLYYLLDSVDHRSEHLGWCASNLVRQYEVVTFEEQPGLAENSQYLYCWPDVGKYRAFAEKYIPVGVLTRDLQTLPTGAEGILPDGVEVWPMVMFLKFDAELDWSELCPGWDSEEGAHVARGSPEEVDEDEDSEDEPDEYESEGIDDSEISEDSSDRDSDLAVLDEDEFRTTHLVLDGNENQTRFSSPDQSSSAAREPGGSESDQPTPYRSRVKRLRSRVVESDSEYDSEGTVPRKRTRTQSRRNRIALSEDDDEDEVKDEGEEKPKIRAIRRVRAVLSEDKEEEDDDVGHGDDDDGEGDGDNDGAEPQMHDVGAAWSGFSSSAEDEEYAGRSTPLARPLSLAEKLQLHREEVQIVESDDGNSDIEEIASDEYDARDYATFQDDEEGIEISEGGGERDELIMDDDDEGYQDYEY